jgi:hypothetical protein
MMAWGMKGFTFFIQSALRKIRRVRQTRSNRHTVSPKVLHIGGAVSIHAA